MATLALLLIYGTIGQKPAAHFSYALVVRDARVVGLGLETLNGECEDQGGTFEGATLGTLPVKPLN